MRTITLRYENGTLIPLDTLDLKEGETITVTVASGTDDDRRRRADVLKAACGMWKGNVDGETMLREIYAARENDGTRKVEI
ncbi:MAG: antitoxin family protein [Candidatus Poribacteria bacterium]|nr:antitoxin family protein [Candidatus Poribacteria bacterium]